MSRYRSKYQQQLKCLQEDVRDIAKDLHIVCIEQTPELSNVKGKTLLIAMRSFVDQLYGAVKDSDDFEKCRGRGV